MDRSSLQVSYRSDGLRVITKYVPYTERIFVEIVAHVGSAHDNPNREGLFHFFEHMAFKGTQRFDEHQIIKNLKRFCRLGNNALTGETTTSYYGIGLASETAEVINILLDIYQNSIFPEKAIEKEKDVVLTEAAQARNSDNTMTNHYLCNLLYSQEHPLAKLSVGTKEGLAQITSSTLREARNIWYSPSNTTVLAIGNLAHGDITEKIFSQTPIKHLGAQVTRNWDDESLVEPYKRERVRERKDCTVSTIYYGIKIPRYKDLSIQARVGLGIAIHMLGKGEDSMLWKELRLERGLVYGTGAALVGPKAIANYLGFYAAMLPEHTDAVKEAIPRIVLGMDFNEDHFNETKDHLLRAYADKREGPREWIGPIERHIFDIGEVPQTFEETLQKVTEAHHEITFDTMREIARTYINEKDLACAMTVPSSEEEEEKEKEQQEEK